MYNAQNSGWYTLSKKVACYDGDGGDDEMIIFLGGAAMG